MVGTGYDILLETIPSFWNCLVVELLKVREFAPQGIGFAQRKILGKK